MLLILIYSFNNLCILRAGTSIPPNVWRYYPVCPQKLKNLNFSASGIYRIYILISYYYYVRGLQYMPPRVLALWGQNPAGAIIYVCFPERLAYDLLGSTPLATERLVWWKRRSAEYGIGVRRTEQEYRVCQKIVYFAYKDSILTRLRVFHFMPP
jgi:hypothetical protein